MDKSILKYFLLGAFFIMSVGVADAQKKTKPRAATKRAAGAKANTAKNKKTKGKTKATVTTPNATENSVTKGAATSERANDSLPIPVVKKSLRPDEAVETSTLKDRTPLPYENLRADDAMFRHKIWREIDIREKINLPFRYKADENNGNQRFISILLQAIQDSAVTVFSSIDDRFTTPMTKAEVATQVVGEKVPVKVYGPKGEETVELKYRDFTPDSVYKYHLKEEVIFDRESSRLFWRILGIAPVMGRTNVDGVYQGETELFWVYYPDMRPIFAKYDVYNGKNFGARMSWEELFEGRMFYGRIVKSTIDNPYNREISEYPGLKNYPILQLLEGENIKEKIFNYEQDLWSY